MKTTKIFKSEVTNHNIWKLILLELGLPLDTDEITFRAIDFSSDKKEQKEERMKIAIDLDNTITANSNSVEFFSIMTHLLIACHKIYIITNRDTDSEQEIAEELDSLEVEYSEIIVTADKAKFIKENGIQIFFEDTDEYFLELGPEVTVFKIREAGNFSFSEKKWIGGKTTTKMIDE
jgi:hypothetical protein